MKHDVADLPQWSQSWATTRQAQHTRAGNELTREQWTGLRDWLQSLPTQRPRMVDKLHKLTLEQAMLASIRWHEAMAARQGKLARQKKSFGGDPEGVSMVTTAAHAQQGVELAQQGAELGWHWVHVNTPQGLDYEGSAMGHCVGGGGYDEGCTIYSLRDSDNMPHCTIEWDPDTRVVNQVQGRANGPVVARYHDAVVSFINGLEPTQVQSPGRFGHLMLDGRLVSWADLEPGQHITGDLDIDGCETLTALPSGLSVDGDAFLADLPMLALMSEDMRIGKDIIILDNHGLRHITGNLDVGGDIIIDGCPVLESITGRIRAGQGLHLRRCPGLMSLPRDLEFNGALSLTDCPGVQSLPNGLSVDGDFKLGPCARLTSLPTNLRVTRNLLINHCDSITSLPKDMVVGGNLNIHACAILADIDALLEIECTGMIGLHACPGLVSLPDGLHVRGNLRLYELHNLAILPRGMVVDGDLHLSRCSQLTMLPDDLVVGGNLYYLSRLQNLAPPPPGIRVGGDIFGAQRLGETRNHGQGLLEVLADGSYAHYR